MGGGLTKSLKIEKEPDLFEINCYSYQDLYSVRYEALRKHIFSKFEVDK